MRKCYLILFSNLILGFGKSLSKTNSEGISVGRCTGTQYLHGIVYDYVEILGGNVEILCGAVDINVEIGCV